MAVIQLFNPPVHHYAGVQYKMNPALGLPILAAVLTNAGHKVSVLDLEAIGVSPEQVGSSFANQKERWPDVVGFTCTTHNSRGVRETIAALKTAGYDRYIAVGGPHVNIGIEQAKEALSWGADVVVQGECEGNIVQIVEMKPNGIVLGLKMGIEEIPAPLWRQHLPRPIEYGGNLPKIGHPEGIAMWSRGCPHECVFCANPVFRNQRIRRMPPENVYRDMKQLKDLGVRSVFVYDDELVGVSSTRHHQWLMKVCELVKPLEMTWKCQGRCSSRVTAAVTKAMYDAGCRAIMWGIESFSGKVLNSIKKGISEGDIWHTLIESHNAGIGNWAFMMVGNYQETPKDLAYTEKRLAEANKRGLIQWRQVTVCTPTPGSELYNIAKDEGWLTEPPEVGPQMNQVYAPTPWLSEKEIGYWKARLEIA